MAPHSVDENALPEQPKPPTAKKPNPFALPPREQPLPRSTLQIQDRFIDEPERLRVAVIGAGLTGIEAGVLLPAKVPNIDLVIYEKNADVGGTWFENIYPGVRCDIPAHVYQSSYEPNTQWTEEFAQGPEIRAYWQRIAEKYGVYDHIKFGHRVDEISWNEDTSEWTVEAHDLKNASTHSAKFDFVVTAIGRFNAWRLPDYPGISEFKGLLRHTSNWDPTFDPSGKRIAVIGNGASGIQLVANIQPRVASLDHYARNKTWVAKSFAGDETDIKPKTIPQELRDSFSDPDVYLKYRKTIEGKYWRGFQNNFKGSQGLDNTTKELIDVAKERTASKPGLVEKLIPDFPPHCRRLTPGPGYFEAITSDNVNYIQDRIKRFTQTGIETEDGTHREVDAIFCATGANVDMVPPFNIRAFGQNLPDLWREGGAHGFPYSYLGIATPGFPNLLFLLGPNGAGKSGSVPHAVEVNVTVVAKILRKVSREGIKAIAPSAQAADDFVQYADAFFNQTVLSEDCSSWYNSGKAGSRIHGLWPGSGAHMSVVHRDPRWEDWVYEYKTPENRFAWYFGKGYTAQEVDPESDMTEYLSKPGPVDLRALYEQWWRIH
ncbi:unnamed protein product [Clonostachys rosea f. rosea IK726]|uniref:FAD/NAD(P)-binding domain-containing protein n=2 Tax=Bionectria ochroleuca TaxID=29856 RepID=A0A0B7KM21_BIOOC|nr:unnamed protein product [Clonostachys rosea f. rosea IK726]